MKVNGSYNQQIICQRKNIKSNNENKQNFSKIEKTNDIKYSTDIWKELSDKYDIRNATFQELNDISIQLYEAGKISLFEHGILTFDPSKSPQLIKPNLNLTPVDQNGKRDWIAEYKARAERDLKDNLLSYKNNLKIIGVLNRLL